MNIVRADYRERTFSPIYHSYALWDTHTGSALRNNVDGTLNTSAGTGSHSCNNTYRGPSEDNLPIQTWLSPLDPYKQHQDVRNLRLDGIGDWVLKTSEFESWYGGRDCPEKPVLICYGSQGVGKTYISSLIIDTLRSQIRGQNAAVLSLYCNYPAQNQSPANLIGALLKQVVAGLTEVSGEINYQFKESRKLGGQGLRLTDMANLFVKASRSFVRVFICIDAVDELPAKDRPDFIRALRRIIDGAPKVRLVLTSRPHVRVELNKHLAGRVYIIQVEVDQGDITRYVQLKIDDDPHPGVMSEDLRKDIMKTMLEETSGMFLLVVLGMAAILGETTKARRQKMLATVMTAGVALGDMYGETLQRIKEQNDGQSRLGMQLLMWVSHSQRPLKIDELCHALAVEIGSTDLDLDNAPSANTVLDSCLGLVIMDKNSTLRLIHDSLREYLSNQNIFPRAHQMLAETCLTCLNFSEANNLSAGCTRDLLYTSIFEYSSLYWGIHAKAELSDCAKSLAVELSSRKDNHVSATLLFQHLVNYHHLFSHYQFTGLHCASYFGIVEIVEALIEMKGFDINQIDCIGRTPLMWAVRRGNEGVVKLLLSRGDIDPGKADNDGATPLSWASLWGHEGVVRQLLARDNVNPNKPDNYGGTPLLGASAGGHEGVVRLLLARDDVNPNVTDHDGQTPLCCASSEGFEGVVRLLLARGDVNPNKQNGLDETPLWCASSYDREGVVRILLARDDVNLNMADCDGQTPLSEASSCGHEGVVRLLLARGDVNPDKPDNCGVTSLSGASAGGYEGVVRLLLARDDVNPNNPNNYGGTPLSGVVGLLLARGDVNPDKPDNNGQTPLALAASGGYGGVVRLLLARTDVNPGRSDNQGQTPFQAASMNGHGDIVTLLQARIPAISNSD